MSQEARYFRVGAFVLGGIALAVALLVALAGGQLWRRPVVVETYIAESVQGLEVGSPVKLRGVKLGTVSSIGFVGDAYLLPSEPERLTSAQWVLVRMELAGDPDDRRSIAERQADVQVLVDHGLRVRLTPLGITGTSFIEADYLDPQKYPPLAISWTPDHLYIPSAPSTINQLSSAAERVMERVSRIDVEELLNNLDKLAVSLNTSVSQADVPGLQRSVAALLADLQKTSGEARRTFEQADVGALRRDTQTALAQLTETLERLQQVVETSGGDFGSTLENLRVATENLREVTETAKSYPSSLVFGGPPAPLPETKR
jgi:paraquat-inducible protein B